MGNVLSKSFKLIFCKGNIQKLQKIYTAKPVVRDELKHWYKLKNQVNKKRLFEGVEIDECPKPS